MKPGAETQRQLLHIAACSFALLLPFLSTAWAFALAAFAFIHNILLLPRYAPHLFRAGERMTHGISAYPLMVMVLILMFPDRLNMVGCVWGILSFGDGFSNLAGRKLPLAPLPWNPKKTWGGLIAFFVAGASAGWFFLWWIGPVPSLLHLAFVATAAAAAAAMLESVALPWDDNITVTLTAAATAAMCWPLDFALYSEPTSLSWRGMALAINLVFAAGALSARLVSVGGAAGGLVIGTLLLIHGGIDFYLLLLTFFTLCAIATRIGFHEKSLMGCAQDNKGRRGAKHALANCLVPVLAALGYGLTEGADLWFALLYCGSVATAFSDTISSELGQLLGRSPFMPGTFHLTSPGTPGAISVEGTLCGMAAAALLAGLAALMQTIPLDAAPAVMIGAWIGFYAESYIAARWMEEGVEISNEWLNLLNTAIGGLLTIILAYLTL